MSDEITHNYTSGAALYACRFQRNGNVFLTDGASDEVWGTGGRDANYYDVAMTEEGVSGHYKGDFDASGNIAAGIYPVVIRVGAVPANDDVILGQGSIHWDGTAEIDSALDEVIEGTLTYRQAMRLLLAVWANISSGGGTSTITYRDYEDTKDRISGTVDKDGNRTAIVKDVT